ncbi:MAG: GNAT family N-acetyltransferase [Burkholderiales bacterium]|nr:GNAT family N-acetyltransferase [Burkholderiales bacterium]
MKGVASRIYLRPPALADQREFTARARASRKLHHPWVTAAATPVAFRQYVQRMAQPGNCALFVCVKETHEIAGVVNITNIILGVFRSAYLGYYAFAGFEGRGLMREGLAAVARHAFTQLKLHRLEANIQPGNAPSIALVKACGFAREGYSPRYLKIGGRWRDHERWAIVAS